MTHANLLPGPAALSPDAIGQLVAIASGKGGVGKTWLD